MLSHSMHQWHSHQPLPDVYSRASQVCTAQKHPVWLEVVDMPPSSPTVSWGEGGIQAAVKHRSADNAAGINQRTCDLFHEPFSTNIGHSLMFIAEHPRYALPKSIWVGRQLVTCKYLVFYIEQMFQFLWTIQIKMFLHKQT